MTISLLSRPARLPPPPVPEGKVELAPPPRLSGPPDGGATWLQPFLPVVGSIGALLFVLSNPRPLFVMSGILFALGACGMGFGLFWNQRAGSRRRTAEERRRYLAYLHRTRDELRTTAVLQREAATWRHPDPTQLWAVARSRLRVWERRPDDDDALLVRIGVGRQPLATPLSLRAETDPLIAREPVSATAVASLLSGYGEVEGLPIPLSLPGAGVLSVVGPRPRVLDLVRALLGQVATFHPPDDVRIAVLASPDRAASWEWCKWLPHAAAPEGADESGPLRLLLADEAELDALVGADRPGHLVVVVDGGRAEDGAGAGTGGAERMTLIHLVDRQANEPPSVDLRLRVDAVGRLVVEEARSGTVQSTGTADALGPAGAESLARALAPLRLSPDAAEGALSATVGLPDLLGIPDVADLDPASMWRSRSSRRQLRVPIGVGSDGAPVHLDLKESALGGMGPHGLCVGATGSGKSELLRTLVTGLAVTHPPETLSFVLVDYKGGAAFAGLAELPHVAGVITNLADDAALVERMHDALFGEQRRRQEALRAAGNLASVREYAERRAAGADLEPLPSLLVVVDEFSELLANRPDFIDLFVAIGRLGRSLGMHLLLASQRLDEGRLRGLESHLSYRIGLRTFSAVESRAVLGVPDAYSLPPLPGSGYLKVDTTVFQRFKAALVSGTYRPRVVEAPTLPAPVPFPAVNQVVESAVPPNPDLDDPEDDLDDVDLERRAEGVPSTGTGGAASVLEVAVGRLHDAAAPTHRVWLPPLDPAIPLDRLLPPLMVHPDRGLVAPDWPGIGRLAPPVGMLDRPREQAQEALVVDLSGHAGHLAVVGAPQSGKSTLLRTLVGALALTHTPTEVQFHCLDFGGGALYALEGLPHVGTVTGRADPERVRRVVQEVHGLLDEREALFRARGIDSPASFRALRSAGALPDQSLGDVFLVVDGWAALRAEFEDLDPLVVDLAARGLGYAVHLVLSANRWMEIRPNLKDSLAGRLELRLNDPGDSDVDRRLSATLSSTRPGRGLTQDRLQFQTALPRVDGSTEPATMQPALEQLIRGVADSWPGPSAAPVRVLPPVIPLGELPGRGEGAGAGAAVPIGVGEANLGPVYLDLSGSDPHLLVLGDAEAGKTTFLRSLLTGICARSSPEEAQVLVVDYRRTLLDAVPADFLLGYAGAAPAATAEVARARELLAERMPPASLTASQLRERSWWTGPEVFVVVDDYDLVVSPSGNPLAPLMDLLPLARDLGLHVIVTRRVGGAARALYEPFLQRLKELGSQALLMSGDPQEGPLVGPYRALPQPPGRALFVRRRQPPVLVQTAWSPEVAIV